MNSSSIGPFPAQFAYATSTTASVDTARNAGRDVKSSSTDRMAATQELMETCDFTNMTPLQMRDAMMTLTKNGKMSLDESASLMLIAGLAGASPQTPNNGGANRPMDFFAATRELLAYNRHVHNVPGIDHAEKTLSALERLQGKPWRVDASA